jgi:signal peptidase I
VWRGGWLLISLVVLSGCGGGGKSGSGDEAKLRRLATDYVKATTGDDPAASCDLIADSVLKRAVGTTGERGRGICRKNLEGGPPQSDASDFAHFRVVGVDVEEARAEIKTSFTRGGVHVTGSIRAVRQGDDWFVLSTGTPTTPQGDLVLRVPSGAMLPTYEIGDIITVDIHAYDNAEPQRGDVVVFNPPPGAEAMRCGVRTHGLCPKPVPGKSDTRFVKRVAAVPGDRIGLRRGRVIRNGEPDTFPAKLCAPGNTECTFKGTITIPAGHYFVIGDNRGESDDSRYWGPIGSDAILGRVR